MLDQFHSAFFLGLDQPNQFRHLIDGLPFQLVLVAAGDERQDSLRSAIFGSQDGGKGFLFTTGGQLHLEDIDRMIERKPGPFDQFPR